MNNKEENFKRISTNRTNKIISMISLLGNLSNTSFYEYSNEDIDKMFALIQEELDKQHQKLLKQSDAGKRKVEL